MTQCAKIIAGFVANVGNVFIKRLQTFFFFNFFSYVFNGFFYFNVYWIYVPIPLCT